MRTIELLTCRIAAESVAKCVDFALDHEEEPRRCLVVACANPHSLVVARNDEHFLEALRSADLLLPDGAGIVLGAKLTGQSMAERVAGTEFFLETCGRATAASRLRFFFLGSTQAVLAGIVERIHREFPHVQCAGTYSPPFAESVPESESRKIIDAINSSSADILWVGMTAPKQEKWIQDNAPRIDARMAVGIGAAFDFYAGTRKRAPQWVRNLGLEWLPRLIREPGRLWRRNFVSTPAFLMLVLREAWRRRFASKSGST
jgi:N-acetylglucosaminyldiphosphoundecaprenol N-acetyl-beta-D-mannosaminyltransferase